MPQVIILTEEEAIAEGLDQFPICRQLNDLNSFKMEDLVVVMVSFSQLVPTNWLNRAEFLNVHNSLLPSYRGMHAFTWALIHGEKVVGYTLHRVIEQVDAGDIVDQVEIPVSDDEDINDIFSKAHVQLMEWLPVRLALIKQKGVGETMPQSEAKASYFQRRKPEDSRIDWNQGAIAIRNLVRAVSPPYTRGAYALREGEEFRFSKAERTGKHSRRPPGEVLLANDSEVVVATLDEDLRLTVESDGLAPGYLLE